MMANRQRRRLLIGALLTAPLGLIPLLTKQNQIPILTVHDAIRYLNHKVFRVAHEQRIDGPVRIKA